MGFVCAIAMMVAVFAVVWILSRWDARSAYRMLEHSQMFFEPEKQVWTLWFLQTAPLIPRSGRTLHLSSKKRVAAKQKWVCAVCKNLLDETFEIDHIVPLFGGGTNDERNLQALCKRDHALKSALEQQK